MVVGSKLCIFCFIKIKLIATGLLVSTRFYQLRIINEYTLYNYEGNYEYIYNYNNQWNQLQIETNARNLTACIHFLAAFQLTQ